MDAEFLAQLACPRCKGPLSSGAAAAELICPACLIAFPLRDGVPILLLEEARPAADELPRRR